MATAGASSRTSKHGAGPRRAAPRREQASERASQGASPSARGQCAGCLAAGTMRAPRLSAPTALLLPLLCLLSATPCPVCGDVRTPSATTVVQGLRPSGVRISVPDAPGIDVVIISANVNSPLESREKGQISGTVLEPRNGFWILESPDVQVKPKDVVFYWVYTAIGSDGDRVGGNQPIHDLVDPSCEPTSTTVNGRPACRGQLIFEDNFDTFNKSTWMHSIQFSDDPDFDFTTYVANPENSFVKDGKLHLKATVLDSEEIRTPTKLEGCTWARKDSEFCERKPIGWNILPPTRSAMLTSKGTFSFKYGRIDIRAKTAAGDWLYSRVQLSPQENAYGSNPFESGRVEITRVRGNADLVEGSGLQSGACCSNLQVDMTTCNRRLWVHKFCELKVGKLYSDEMHLYSAVWTPQSITISVDDCVHVVKAPNGSFLQHNYFKNCNDSPWKTGTHFVPFDREFFMQLSLMVGGNYVHDKESKSNGKPKPWSDNDPKGSLTFWTKREDWFPTWKSDMEIDYIKVWAL